MERLIIQMRNFDGVFLMLLKLLLLHAEATTSQLSQLCCKCVPDGFIILFVSLRLVILRIKYSSQTLACRSICAFAIVWSALCYMMVVTCVSGHILVLDHIW